MMKRSHATSRLTAGKKARKARGDTTRPIRILIAEKSPRVRAGFRSLLEIDHRMKVVAEAEDGLEALRLIGRHHPAVALMNVALPRLSGINALKRAAKRFPRVRFIILSENPDKAELRKAVDAGTRLDAAIRTVAAGGTYITPIARQLRSNPVKRGSFQQLSPRQREILQFIADGYSNKQIAAILNISPNTVDTHRTRFMKLLDLHDVASVVRWAIRVGLATAKH